MPTTRFDPSLDGFPPGFNLEISAQEASQIREIYHQAGQEALADMRQAYYDGVRAYNLAHYIDLWVNHWSSDADLKAAGIKRGLLFATLDHYQVALPLPTRNTLETQEFRTYLQTRNLEHLHQDVTSFLVALCIYTLIPEDWAPNQTVSERIRQAVSSLKIVETVQIELDLGLQPGSKPWLDQQTRISLDEIRVRIDSGMPCPAWILRSPGSLFQHNLAIIYGYEQLTEATLLLQTYNLDCPGEVHQVLVEQIQERLQLQESCTEHKPMTIQGLLLLNYSPGFPPEASVPWWGELEFVRRLVWNGRHLWKRLQRGISVSDNKDDLQGSI